MGVLKKTKVLLVEDDKNLGFVIKDFLDMAGYEVDLKENGQEGYEAFIQNEYQVLLLDVMMPVKDGFTLAEEIKKQNSNIPIIFLTAKSLTEDKIRGLRIGADDYITKPFSTEELKLRIEAILRRTKFSLLTQPSGNSFEFGQFKFNPESHILEGPNGEKKLTNKESDLLYLLVLNKNQVLRRDIALKTIWGENDYFMGRSMDVYITKLRKILKADDSISISNIHNIGFRLEIEIEAN